MEKVSEPIFCSQEGCTKSYKNTAWDRIKAEGWFFQKDGSSWCPDHIPDWVEEWRAKKREQQSTKRI